MNAHIHIPLASHLQGYVIALWEHAGSNNSNDTILPQGAIEIVFNLADPMQGSMAANRTAFDAPLCFVQGINTEVVNVKYGRQQHLFGIRLQPHMVQPLLHIAPSELKNTLVDLTLINPRFKTLWHQLIGASTFDARVKLVEKDFPVLSQPLCSRTEKLSNIFQSDDISDFQSVDSLTQQVYYSPRHLNRKTQSMFGLSAEEMIVYKKYLHAVKLMHLQKCSLTDIAYQCGFYDQAHFCRIFKNYSGITAKQYQLNKSELPFHLFS